MRYLLVVCAFFGAFPAFADDHSCPADRPYPRGSAGCDSCDAADLVDRYNRGELTETRASTVFDHKVSVTVFCDDNRPVNVEDVFAQISRAENEFMALLGRSIDRADGFRDSGRPRVQEVVVGICDTAWTWGGDDCAMHKLCVDEEWVGCDIGPGRAHRGDDVWDNKAWIPWLPDGRSFWVEGNRYSNLHHEYAHMLDFTYVRQDWRLASNTYWWSEGMPQYIQMVLLGETESWRRSNYDASLLDVFTFRADPYYDGMRVFAYLREHDPWTLERIADVVKSGVYAATERHQYWHDLLGHTSWRHQRAWEWWNSVKEEQYVTTDASPTPGILQPDEQPHIMGRVRVHRRHDPERQGDPGRLSANAAADP